MLYDPNNPFIVQGDRTVLVEVDNPRYPEARDALAPFAELEKSPEHIHTYRLSPLSLWNAAAAGMTAEAMVEALTTYSKFPIPVNVPVDIRELVSGSAPLFSGQVSGGQVSGGQASGGPGEGETLAASELCVVGDADQSIPRGRPSGFGLIPCFLACGATAKDLISPDVGV